MATMSQEEQERADMEAVLECCISGSSPGRHISKEQERSDCSETDELAGFLPPPLNLASAAVREVLDRHESPAQRPSSMRGHEKKSSPFHRSYTERNMPLRASTTQPYSSPPLRGAEVFTGHTDSVIHLRGTQTKLVLGMVGLPARGKTYIAQKLARYLSWLGYNCKVFNIGNYRRALVGAQKQNDFFDPNNAEAVAERERCAIATLDAMYKFFLEGGHAAIYDGTNSTNQRREMVLNYIKKQDVLMKTRLVWVESICDIPELIYSNIRNTKVHSPDYQHIPPEEAVRDFAQRIAQYEKAYEPLRDEAHSWVKLINAGRQVFVNRCFGYLPTRLVFFLMNLNIEKKAIYLTRHGQSTHNITGLIGGDPDLSEQGKKYSMSLAKFLSQEPEVREMQREGEPLRVWSSTLRRTIQTAKPTVDILNVEAVQWRTLDEINAGTCDGLTYESIAEKFPDEFKARKKDKLNYRYPQGESYRDVIHRLEAIIFELERVKGPVVVVAHQAVLRCLYSYFFDIPIETIPHLAIPLHTVVKIKPQAYGLAEERFELCKLPPEEAAAGSSGHDYGDTIPVASPPATHGHSISSCKSEPLDTSEVRAAMPALRIPESATSKPPPHRNMAAELGVKLRKNDLSGVPQYASDNQVSKTAETKKASVPIKAAEAKQTTEPKKP